MTTFHVAMLASGSKGNAALVSAGTRHFLVDAGLSCRELNRRLQTLGLGIEKLDAVFITHEHIDHIKGLETLCKNYRVPVYATLKTWYWIFNRLKISDKSCCLSWQQPVTLDGVTIDHFPVPHDAADPHGYTFTCNANGAKCTYLTDTGFVTDEVRQAAENSEILILEANHDVEMLKNGSYPQTLKQRILSTRGHLSNESAGRLLALLECRPKIVFLAHLSEENNRPALACKTVRDILKKHGLKPGDMQIFVASQHEVVRGCTAVQEEIFS